MLAAIGTESACTGRKGLCPLKAAKSVGRNPLFEEPNIDHQQDQIRPEARALINELARERQPWPLFLFGPTGGGKTALCLCLREHYAGWYVDLASLCGFLIGVQRGEQYWPGPTGGRIFIADFWRRWRCAAVTIVDEIALRQQPSDFEYEVLKKAIDEREGKPAVFVSNLDIDGIMNVYDARIADRLAAGTALELTGNRRVIR